MEIGEFLPQKIIAKALPWAPLKIMPIGDLQYNGNTGYCDTKLLTKTIERALAEDAYFIGMGDYLDILSPSNRARLRAANLYDTAEEAIDLGVSELERQLFAILKPTKGRWLGMLEGHHYFEHLDGTTSDTRLAEWLEAPYLGSCGMLRIVFRDGHRGVTLKLWAHHGSGGGMKASAPMNKLENLAPYFDAQLMMMGHTTKLVAAPLNQLYVPDSGVMRLFHRKRLLVSTGSFNLAYMEGRTNGRRPQGTYAEQRMLPPSTIGAATITATPLRERHSSGVDNLHVDLTVTL